MINGQLASGLKWSDFSKEQQEYILNQDLMNAQATGDALAIPPGTPLDTEQIAEFRNSYSSIKYVYSNRVLKNGSGETVLAMVEHSGTLDPDSNLLNSFEASKIVLFSGNTMHSFKEGRYPDKYEKSLGYHAKVRAGLEGLYDLGAHEMAHTFGNSRALGLNVRKFQYNEEVRADNFLKTVRGF